MWRLVVGVGLVVGPTLGYAAQAYHIGKAKSSEGFSLAVPFILIMASLLRIYFWLGKQFDIFLLLQSVAMLAAQLILLLVCTKYPSPAQRSHSLKKCTLAHFWQWEDFASYIATVAAISVALAAFTYFFHASAAYVELLGYLSLLLEATLVLPQVWENAMRHSVEGLSSVLVAGWVVGDVGKTVYFVLTDSPIQFLVCGTLQLTIDTIIIIQYYIYSPRHPGDHEQVADLDLEEMEVE